MRALMLAALACSLAGCSRDSNSDVTTVAPVSAQRMMAARAQPDVASAVYAALLSGTGYHGVPVSDMLVGEQRVSIPAISESGGSRWVSQFDAIPAQLREALRRPPALKTGPLDHSLFPTGTRFVSQAALDAAFSQGVLAGWTAFKHQHKSDGWVSYSDVLVTRDGLDALVYTEAHCGSLCGRGVYFWLHRTGPAAPWSIVHSITGWIA